jgi:hypothetical protein
LQQNPTLCAAAGICDHLNNWSKVGKGGIRSRTLVTCAPFGGISLAELVTSTTNKATAEQLIALSLT